MIQSISARASSTPPSTFIQRLKRTINCEFLFLCCLFDHLLSESSFSSQLIYLSCTVSNQSNFLPFNETARCGFPPVEGGWTLFITKKLRSVVLTHSSSEFLTRILTSLLRTRSFSMEICPLQEPPMYVYRHVCMRLLCFVCVCSLFFLCFV